MQYEIRFSETVEEDLKDVKAFYTQKILDEIRGQLSNEPDKKTKHRKVLEGLTPPWNAVPPIWQLAVDEYRIFYDVDLEKHIVWIRAVRHKPQGKKTEEIL